VKYALLLLLLVPAFAVDCGTSCDKQGQPGAVDSEGACVLLSETAKINDFSWSTTQSNTSSLKLLGDVDCLCGEQAFCNVTIKSNNTETFWSEELITAYLYDFPPLEYGTNTIILNCSCNSTNVSDTRNGTSILIDVDVLTLYSDSIISPDHLYTTTIGLKNQGNIKSEFVVYDTDHEADNCTADIGDSISSTNSTTVILEPLGISGDYVEVEFDRTMVCGYSGYALHNVEFCDTNIGCPGITETGGCFEIFECYDYEGEYDADLDCQVCGSSLDACSDFHCCSIYQHWENGVCCNLDEICCTENENCPYGFKCDTTLDYCVLKGGVGEICTSMDDCDLSLHCDSNSTLSFSYCTYNDTDDAGIGAPGQCWDEEDWNTSSPYYGCDGCGSSNQCNSSYYCDLSYALCRDCPQGAGSQDSICEGSPTNNCFNLDWDCCENDANCTSLGSDYYCDVDSKVCRICETRQDYYCPSQICYGIDPDCCYTGTSCFAGTICDETGTCVPQVGTECLTSSDCGVGNLVCEFSSCFKKSVCMTPQFINVQPSQVPTDLTIGQTLPISIIVTNPQGCPSTYRLYFTGPSRYFAFFGSRKQQLNITLEPGETRSVPARLSAASIGRLSFIANIVDQDNPSLQDSSSIEFDVQGYTTPGQIVTAPGLGLFHILLILVSSAIILKYK
jgi:hypothetical protein